MQTSVFDGLTAFLIDKVTVPNAYYNGMKVTERHFAVSNYIWHDDEADQGIDFHPFDSSGNIGEAKLLGLEFYPNEWVLNEGILSATGWADN